MSDFKIDKNVSLWRKTVTAKYPFANMQVGDSFFVPGKKSKNMAGSVANAARTRNAKYATRAVDGGVRVWRTE